MTKKVRKAQVFNFFTGKPLGEANAKAEELPDNFEYIGMVPEKVRNEFIGLTHQVNVIATKFEQARLDLEEALGYHIDVCQDILTFLNKSPKLAFEKALVVDEDGNCWLAEYDDVQQWECNKKSLSE